MLQDIQMSTMLTKPQHWHQVSVVGDTINLTGQSHVTPVKVPLCANFHGNSVALFLFPTHPPTNLQPFFALNALLLPSHFSFQILIHHHHLFFFFTPSCNLTPLSLVNFLFFSFFSTLQPPFCLHYLSSSTTIIIPPSPPKSLRLFHPHYQNPSTSSTIITIIPPPLPPSSPKSFNHPHSTYTIIPPPPPSFLFFYNSFSTTTQVPSCQLSEDLGQLYDRSSFSDFTLCVGGRLFHVHKAILAGEWLVVGIMMVGWCVSY